MPSIASFRARLCLEALPERCLLSYGLGPTVQVSQDDPFAGIDPDDIEHQTGTLYPGTSLETFLATDPTNPDHLAGIWQQDRWSNGGARGLVVGISWDGGQTWQDTPLPGASLCSGGTSKRASDPWIAFASNGDLYATTLTVNGQGSPGNVLVSKSTDGGVSWQDPVLIPNSNGADKESITTDPSDPQTVYVVWTGRFSRSTDGGQTFSPAQSVPTGSGSQIVVLPDGTLIDSDAYEVFRSTDQGQHWGPRITVANFNSQQVIDPNTHQLLRAGLGLGDIAVDSNTGTVYIVVEDARLAGNQHDTIAFTQSTDDGLTRSTPVAVNQTPTNIPSLDQQAFIPTVQVGPDGTVGVAYYDFRFNQAGPDLPTDFWFVPGTPDGSGGITWGDELRLTDTSFNFEDAPFSVYGKFVGDYQGRAPAGSDFLNQWGETAGPLVDVVSFRRVINLGDTAGAARAALRSALPALADVLPFNPAEPSAPVAIAPDRPTNQPLSVDVAARPDLGSDRSQPSATPFAADHQGLMLAAPSPSSDVAMPASPLSEELLWP